jgi:hypothetical protein
VSWAARSIPAFGRSPRALSVSVISRALGLVDAVKNDASALGIYLGDFPSLAVVDSGVAVVDPGDEKIAGGKWAAADHDLLSVEPTFGLDQLARGGVQPPNLDVSLRHHQRVLALGVGAPPVLDHHHPALLGVPGDRDPLLGSVEAQGLQALTIADELRRFAVELVVVADHFMQVDGLGALRDRGEQPARLDRAKLLGVSDQDQLCSGLIGVADHSGQMLRTDHPGLIDQKDRARGQGKLATAEVPKKTGDGSRLKSLGP